MTRSTVTTLFEVLGFLLIAAAAGLVLLDRVLALSLGIAGVVLIAESLLVSLMGPRRARRGTEVG